MTYLVFSTQAEADNAQALISQNMGFTGSVTSAWAIPQQRATDGKWYFLKPEDSWMTGVTGYTEEEFSSGWLPENGRV
jgi:hypothetical protein